MTKRVSICALSMKHIFADLAAKEGGLILAMFEVSDVRALYGEFDGQGVDCPQPVTRQPWRGTDFHIRDPDGNRISFVPFE